MRQKGWRLTPGQVEAICRRYAAGETIQQLARDIGCSEGAIHYVLMREGVPRRRRGTHRRT